MQTATLISVSLVVPPPAPVFTGPTTLSITPGQSSTQTITAVQHSDPDYFLYQQSSPGARLLAKLRQCLVSSGIQWRVECSHPKLRTDFPSLERRRNTGYPDAYDYCEFEFGDQLV
jgi:hypothetical protein